MPSIGINESTVPHRNRDGGREREHIDHDDGVDTYPRCESAINAPVEPGLKLCLTVDRRVAGRSGGRGFLVIRHPITMPRERATCAAVPAPVFLCRVESRPWQSPAVGATRRAGRVVIVVMCPRTVYSDGVNVRRVAIEQASDDLVRGSAATANVQTARRWRPRGDLPARIRLRPRPERRTCGCPGDSTSTRPARIVPRMPQSIPPDSSQPFGSNKWALRARSSCGPSPTMTHGSSLDELCFVGYVDGRRRRGATTSGGVCEDADHELMRPVGAVGTLGEWLVPTSAPGR